jgi:hypothetical protein
MVGFILKFEGRLTRPGFPGIGFNQAEMLMQYIKRGKNFKSPPKINGAIVILFSGVQPPPGSFLYKAWILSS